MRALLLLVVTALVACGEVRSPSVPATSGSGDAPPNEPAPAASMPPSSSAMPPPTPKKAGCLDSTHGAKHTFVGRLERHPDGSGALRVHLAKKVCFSGGRFSQGETDEVILDIDAARAKPLLTKKVKVSGTSEDFAPLDHHSYVMRLDVTSLAAAK